MEGKPDPLTRVIRAVAAAVVIAGLVWVLVRLRLVILLLIGSAWMAYALDPLVQFFSNRRRQLRPVGIALAYLTVSAILALIGIVALGPAVRDVRELAATLPTYAQRLQEWETHASATLLERLPPGARTLVDQAAGEASGRLRALGVNLAQRSVALVISISALLGALALMLVLSILLLADKEYLKDQVFRLIPTRFQEEAAALLGQIDAALSAFVRGQLLIAAAVGVVLSGGMRVLNVEYAVLLGLFAGITQLVPDVGAVVGIAVAVGLTAFQSLWLSLKVLVLFLVVFQFAARLLGPWVMSRTVRIHSLVIILATVAGAVLGGVIGALLAVPVAATLKVLVSYAYDRLAPRWKLGPPPKVSPLTPPAASGDRSTSP